MSLVVTFICPSCRSPRNKLAGICSSCKKQFCTGCRDVACEWGSDDRCCVCAMNKKVWRV